MSIGSICKMVACLFFLVLCTSTRADANSSDEVRTISLNDAVAKTIERNPGLIAFGYQVKAQDARVVHAGLAPNPELVVLVENALGTGDFQGIDGTDTTLSLGWVLERGVRQRRVDAAHAGVSVLMVEGDVQRLDAAAETARRFLRSLADQARLVGVNEAARLARETVEAVQARVESGRAPEAELARAEAELARVMLDQEDVEYGRLSANRRLAAQWGDTEPRFPRVSGDLYRLPVTDSFATLRARVEQNPDLYRFISDERLREAELRLAQAQRRPSWRVTAGVRRLQRTHDQAFLAGITIPLALRNRNQGRIAEARANLARASADREVARIRIETQLFVLYQELLRSLQRAKTLRDDILPRAEMALADTRRAYDLGRYGYYEWRVVQAELLNARTALIEASIDAHRNVIEIERLTGVRIAQAQPAETP